MFIVISKWRPLPGKENEFSEIGAKMRSRMRNFPGVKFVHGLKNEEDQPIAIVGYESKEAWDSIVNDPNGPFALAAQEHNIEEIAEWISSDRGESIDD